MRGPWWYEEPACAEVGSDFWFPDKAEDSREIQMAKRLCHSCTHKEECLEWGINNEAFGIWGGLTSKERQRIRVKRKRQSA
jgi:WhiB family redox-sensing transcriptional regulator